MSKPRRRSESHVPPQLVGILADAVAIGATAFRLEPNPPHTMASFAAGSQASEIDFEAWSGREIMKFLADRVTDVKKKAGQFEMECDGKKVRVPRRIGPVAQPDAGRDHMDLILPETANQALEPTETRGAVPDMAAPVSRVSSGLRGSVLRSPEGSCAGT